MYDYVVNVFACTVVSQSILAHYVIRMLFIAEVMIILFRKEKKKTGLTQRQENQTILSCSEYYTVLISTHFSPRGFNSFFFFPECNRPCRSMIQFFLVIPVDFNHTKCELYLMRLVLAPSNNKYRRNVGLIHYTLFLYCVF